MAALRSLILNLQARLAPHRELLHLLGLLAVFRLLISLTMVVGSPVLPFTLAAPDLIFTQNLGRLSAAGLYPFLDFWMEYPPLLAYYMVGIYRAASLVPTWTDGLFVLNLFFRWAAIPFDLGSLALLYSIIRKTHGERPAIHSATAMALLFAPLYISSQWYDNLVLFFILLSVYAVVERRAALGGLVMGLGFGIKLFPLAVLPTAVQVFRKEPRQLLIVGGLLIAVIAAIFVPFFMASPEYTLPFFRNLGGRVPWQSIWALLVGYRSYGVVAPVALRTDPAQASWVPPVEGLHDLPPWAWLLLAAAFAGLGLWLYTRRIDWQEPRRQAAFVALTFAVMFLYLRGFSQQFYIYALALSLLIAPDWRGTLYGLCWSSLMVLIFPLSFATFWRYPDFNNTWIIVQTLLLLAFLAEALRATFYDHPLSIRFQNLPVLASALILTVPLIVWTPIVIERYGADRLRESAVGPFISEVRDGVRPGRPMLLTSAPLRETIEPYLADLDYYLFPTVLGEYAAGYNIEAWANETIAPGLGFYVVHDTLDPRYDGVYQGYLAWLNAQACPVSETYYENIWVGEYVRGEVDQVVNLTADFDGASLTLSGAAWSAPGPGESTACFRLDWRFEAPPDDSYAAFVQVLDASGQFVAGSDRWIALAGAAESQISTRHGLILDDPGAGPFRVIAGVYSLSSGQRLSTAGSDVLNLSTWTPSP